MPIKDARNTEQKNEFLCLEPNFIYNNIMATFIIAFDEC